MTDSAPKDLQSAVKDIGMFRLAARMLKDSPEDKRGSLGRIAFVLLFLLALAMWSGLLKFPAELKDIPASMESMLWALLLFVTSTKAIAVAHVAARARKGA